MKLSYTSRSRKRQLLTVLVAGLCIVLILFIGVTQLLHTHAANEADSSSCSLCAVAHLTVILAPMLAGPVMAESVVQIRPPEIAHAPPRFFSFSLYVRPPPVLNAYA